VEGGDERRVKSEEVRIVDVGFTEADKLNGAAVRKQKGDLWWGRG